MTSPAFRSSSSGTDTTAGSATRTYTKPSGTADGDALILFVTVYASTTATCGTPAGWTLRSSTGATGGQTDTPKTWLFTKLASGEPASWSSTCNGYSEYICHAITGADTSFFDLASYNNGNDTAPTATSITTSAADELLVAAAMGYGHNTTTLGGMTIRVNGLDGVNSSFDVAQAVAGASGNKVGTYGGPDYWNCILVGVKSPGAVGPTTITRTATPVSAALLQTKTRTATPVSAALPLTGWNLLDETTPDASDYIESEPSPAASPMVVRLGTVTEPGAGNRVLWVQLENSTAGGDMNYQVELLQGASVVQDFGTVTVSSTTPTVVGLLVTATITDWSTPFDVRITATGV